jgi:hypothetical protein
MSEEPPAAVEGSMKVAAAAAWAEWVAALGAAVGLAGFQPGEIDAGDAGWLASFAVAASGFLCMWLARAPRLRKVRVDRDGVHVDGRLRAPVSRIRAVEILIATTGRYTLRFRTAHDRALLHVCADPSEAERILEVLGREHSTLTRDHRGSLRLLRVSLIEAGAMAALVLTAIAWTVLSLVSLLPGVAFTSFFAAWAAYAESPVRLRVGDDGVEERHSVRRRFHSFADVQSVVTTQTGIYLRKTDGTEVRLWASSSLFGATEVKKAHGDQLHALACRTGHWIAGALDRYREASMARRHVDHVGFAGRPIEEWIDAARRTAAGPAYRVPDREALLAVAVNATSDPTARIVAAAALRPTMDDDFRGRLRRAADATAAPRVRIALEAAVDDDGAELEAQLRAVVRGAAKRRSA